MKELTQLVKAMTSSEIKQLKGVYRVSANGEERKKLFLFRLIKDEGFKSDTQASKRIYNSLPNSAFSQLKRRLQKDILSVILMQDTTKKKLAPYRQAEIECRRLLIEGDLLLQRGVYQSAVNILERAAKIAEEYELPAEQIMIKDLLRTHLGFRKGLKEYQKYTDSIHVQILRLNDILEAKKYYNNILLPNIFKKNQESEFLEFTEEAFHKLEKIYHKTKSANIGYFYYYIGLYYYEMKHDTTRALEVAEKFLDMVEHQKPIHSSARVAGANLQIANLCVATGQYVRAIQHCEKALSGFKRGLLNELQALEVMFMASVRSHHLQVTQTVIERAFLNPKITTSEMTNAKWFYYRSNYEFVRAQYGDAQKYLNKSFKLAQDKGGWLFGHKLLEILILIEMKDLELIDFRVESLRKLVQRQKGKNIARIKTITQIMTSFVKLNYDFKRTAKKHEKELALLKEVKGDYFFDPMGYEVIRFDEWFENKLP